MLLRFEVENHRSIWEPVELSMIAIDKDRAAARQIAGIGDEQVLTVAGIYGANASGKTNLIDALSWLSKAVRLSLYTRGEALRVDPFKFAPEPGPTSYGVDLVVNAVPLSLRVAGGRIRGRLRGFVQLPTATSPNAV